MKSGMIFDLQEFSVHDGPGIRLTVFLKGCPLRCRWCHNPEGFSRETQVLRGPGWERMAGTPWTSAALVERIQTLAPVLEAAGGGVTFSGGEVLGQADFVLETVAALNRRVHVLIDTSGFGSPADFKALAECADLVFFGLRLADPNQHRRFTGEDNALIFKNLEQLKRMPTPFVARIPLIPGVTDTDENLSALAARLADAPRLEGVELLPYNPVAGAKYAAAGLEFNPGFDEQQPLNLNTEPFRAAGLKVRIV